MTKSFHQCTDCIDYYNEWCNETISWKSGNNTVTGTRLSLGVASQKQYEQYLKIRLELINDKAIIDPCISCKSKNTTYHKGLWKCNDCNQTWNPFIIRYKGI